jgi:hypothetical protein
VSVGDRIASEFGGLTGPTICERRELLRQVTKNIAAQRTVANKLLSDYAKARHVGTSAILGNRRCQRTNKSVSQNNQ